MSIYDPTILDFFYINANQFTKISFYVLSIFKMELRFQYVNIP